MREEIAAAIVFLTRVMRETHDIPKDKISEFSDFLSAILVERYKNHWYSEKPLRGQAYRCVRLTNNHHHDPVLKHAADQSALEWKYLWVPVELQLWIDPTEVTCGLGELKHNQCLVARFKEERTENNALTLDIASMMEKHIDDENKNLIFLKGRGSKKPVLTKSYSPTNELQEKGCYDSDKESYGSLWIEDYSDQHQPYFMKDVRDKRVYLKQQHNSQNRYHQSQVFTSRYHYHNPQKQTVPVSSNYKSALFQNMQVNSNGGTTFFRPIVKNRYQWVRTSSTSPTISA